MKFWLIIVSPLSLRGTQSEEESNGLRSPCALHEKALRASTKRRQPGRLSRRSSRAAVQRATVFASPSRTPRADPFPRPPRGLSLGPCAPRAPWPRHPHSLRAPATLPVVFPLAAGTWKEVVKQRNGSAERGTPVPVQLREEGGHRTGLS